MDKFTLGRTGLEISRTGFGMLPLQRISFDDARALLRRAYEGGITYFDTARAYSDSEEKFGYALADVRKDVVLATKTGARDARTFWEHLETSLTNCKTDYIDVYQFHNPGFVPRPGGADGLYDAAVEAKKQGKIRFISITNHSIDRAFEAVESGLYDTLQYPFNHLASERDVELVNLCREKGVGFIAMKALSGGLVTDAEPAFCYIRQFENAVPIWGFQRLSELEQLLALSEDPPALDADMRARIEKDRRELVGAFCRGCGYCLPCPAEIPINNANRMEQLLTRSPYKNWITPQWQEMMARIENCIRCGACARRCPYDLRPFETLPHHLAFYREFVKAHADEA